MIKQINKEPEIYQLKIPLPNSPLRYLNVYVVKTNEGNLLVDTGFNKPECYDALLMGLRELNIDMNQTILFLTHLHLDHIGLVEKIKLPKTRLIMGAEDYRYLGQIINGDILERFTERFMLEGFPKISDLEQKSLNQTINYSSEMLFDAILLKDGESFYIGNYEYECVFTPGHTPGNTCLYMKKEKIMFLGDHVLFNISPNIIFWPNIRDSLSNYLKSLEKLETYDILFALPAHRENEIDVYERIKQLKMHHFERIETVYNIVKLKNKLNAYEIASQLEWFMRGKSWNEFPKSQKVFAVGETIAHLDYLIECNRIEKFKETSVFVYAVKSV